MINPKAGEAAAHSGPCSELLAALRRLDLLLFTAVREAEAVYGSESPDSRFRGLAISHQGAERYLSRSPFALPFKTIREVAHKGLVDLSDGPAFARLARDFALTQFDLDALLIALAPDLELRYERLFGFIQDDVTRRRPNVELVLDLLCDSPADKLTKRSRLCPDGTLVRHRLVHLLPDPNHVHPPLLGHYLKPDAQVLNLLLGEAAVDARIADIAEVIEPDLSIDDLVLAEPTAGALRAVGEQLRGHIHVLAWFFGSAGSGKTTAAGALAKLAGTRLLSVRLPKADTGVAALTQIALREGLFKSWLVHLSASSLEDTEDFCRELLDPRAVLPSDVVVTAERKPPSRVTSRVIPVHFEAIRREDRRRMWTASLRGFRAAADKETLDTLSRRFRMPPGHIHRAVEEAVRSEVAGCIGSQRTAAETLIGSSLLRAARSQSIHNLSSVGSNVVPHASWDDLILPDDTVAQLRELCRRVDYHDQVFDDWAFAQKLTHGRGNTALFAGPSGTGKTMAAEVVANELGLDLYRIDLARIVSKYIGETEKNLDRVFAAAEGANAILFFDEADALFGKRSEVKDSHDRYANIEISYLLQKMEQYEGIAILASNLRQNLDEAFLRRLAFTIHFPFPDETHRRRIWERIWPKATPVAPEVDLDFMARQFKLSGGNIKNIALSAAFSAAASGSPITIHHLAQATEREFQKLGKRISTAEEHEVFRRANP
jgi:SpoVK/Ycf46/Vps4 family AAA+-type ATPase